MVVPVGPSVFVAVAQRITPARLAPTKTVLSSASASEGPGTSSETEM
jgi:hypothetical protein